MALVIETLGIGVQRSYENTPFLLALLKKYCRPSFLARLKILIDSTRAE
jgi:hypothetical protein